MGVACRGPHDPEPLESAQELPPLMRWKGYGAPAGSHHGNPKFPSPPPGGKSCVTFSASLYRQPRPQAGPASRPKPRRPGFPGFLQPGDWSVVARLSHEHFSGGRQWPEKPWGGLWAALGVGSPIPIRKHQANNQNRVPS